MAVSSTVNIMSPYACDGDIVDFSFTFPIFAQGDLEVWLTDSDGVETKLTLTTHYTIAATNNDYTNGGIVTTIGEAYAEGNTITLRRIITLTQGIDYQENDDFPANTLERGLDRLTLIAQQLREHIDRALTIPMSETAMSIELPVISDRASKLLGFDAEGNLVVIENTM